MTLEHLSVAGWVALVVAALLIGFSKTAIGGIAMVSIAIFAVVLPARASTGAALLLLVAGDLYAVRSYTQYASKPELVALIPSVAVGLTAGTAYLAVADDTLVRRTIGVILLVLVAFAVATKLGKGSRSERPLRRWAVHAFGLLSGFASIVANAAVSIVSLYLLRLKLPVLVFLGTITWFFFVINLVKLPISASLGLIQPVTLLLALLLIPAVFVGAWVGRIVAYRISLGTFEWVVYGVTLAAAVNLVR